MMHPVTRDEVLELMRSRASDLLEIEPDRIQEDVSFVHDLRVDSLDLVEYTMALEDDLGVSLPDEELSEVTDIRGFLDLIMSKGPGRADAGFTA